MGFKDLLPKKFTYKFNVLALICRIRGHKWGKQINVLHPLQGEGTYVICNTCNKIKKVEYKF